MTYIFTFPHSLQNSFQIWRQNIIVYFFRIFDFEYKETFQAHIVVLVICNVNSSISFKRKEIMRIKQLICSIKFVNVKG